MSASARQVQRMLALVPYLQSAQGIPVNRLAREFNVAPRVVRKDLSLLIMTGVGEYHGELIDIDFTALEQDDVVFIRDAEFMSRPLRINVREGAALIAALRALRATADPRQTEIIDSALEKLEHAVGETIPGSVDVHLDPVDPQIRTSVDRALQQKLRLRLEYATASRDEITTRDVDPHRTFTRQGRLYLEGWCHRAQDMRFFRLDRIVTAEVLETPALATSDESSQLGDGFFTPDASAVHAVLDLSPGAHWMAEYYGAEIQEGAAVPDASGDVWRVRLVGGDEAWLARLVIRNAGLVRVVEPESLRAEVLDRARSGLAAYDGDQLSTKE